MCESTANYWIRLHDTLEDNGIDTVLAHPAKTKIIAQAKLKNDKLDSDVLADLLRSDMMVYESFVPEKYYRDLRSGKNKTESCTKCLKTQKHDLCNTCKIRLHPTDNKDLLTERNGWLHEINLTEVDRMAMDAYLENINMNQKQTGTFETKIATISNEDERTRLVMTIPGISYVTALTIISEIADINGFATAEKLVSYAGLAPSHRDREDTKRRRNNKTGFCMVAQCKVEEAANTTIRSDPRMESFYLRIAKRRGKQKARIVAAAAARQMPEIIGTC